MRKYLILSLVALMTAATAYVASQSGTQAQGLLARLGAMTTQCKEYNRAVADLIEKKQERKGRPIDDDGTIFEIWIEGVNGAWTFLMVDGKRLCELKTGSRIENAAPVPVGGFDKPTN